MTPVEFRGDLWHQKTRVPLPGLSCGDVCVILRLAVLVELRFVTTGIGDRLRAGIPSRAVISQLRQLSVASLRGRLIEYQLRLG